MKLSYAPTDLLNSSLASWSDCGIAYQLTLLCLKRLAAKGYSEISVKLHKEK